MWDATALGRQVRTVKMNAAEEEIDKIAVGEKLMRLATEAVDDGVNAGAAFSKISLTVKKLRLDWELSTEALEDNLEGDELEDHVARLMATQAGNDVENLLINGDTTLTSDPLFKSINGWRKLAIAGGHVVDAAGGALDRTIANKVLKAMPRKYMQQRAQLRFFTSSGLIQDYLFGLNKTDAGLVALDQVANRVAVNGPVRTEGEAGFASIPIFGIPTVEVPYFDDTRAGTYSGATGGHGDLWLTYPKNLIWGIKRDVTIYRQFDQKKDTWEWTLFCRVGAQIENADALVVATGVKTQV
jgi:hypothetical protein